MGLRPEIFDFNSRVAAFRKTHKYMAAQAGRAVDISRTLRNWKSAISEWSGKSGVEQSEPFKKEEIQELLYEIMREVSDGE